MIIFDADLLSMTTLRLDGNAALIASSTGVPLRPCPLPDWQRDLIREHLAVLEDVRPEARSVPWDLIRERIFTARRGMPYD